MSRILWTFSCTLSPDLSLKTSRAARTETVSPIWMFSWLIHFLIAPYYPCPAFPEYWFIQSTQVIMPVVSSTKEKIKDHKSYVRRNVCRLSLCSKQQYLWLEHELTRRNLAKWKKLCSFGRNVCACSLGTRINHPRCRQLLSPSTRLSLRSSIAGCGSGCAGERCRSVVAAPS